MQICADGKTYSIPSVNPGLVRMLQQWQALLLVQNPLLPLWIAVTHCSEDDLGDFEAGLAETIAVLASRSCSACSAIAGIERAGSPYLTYSIFSDMVSWFSCATIDDGNSHT